MPNRYEEVAKIAADITNAQFDSELSSLTRLKDEELGRLFPRRADKENLLNLLRIVNSATSQNDKINSIRRNLNTLGGTVIKLIKHLA